MLAGATSHTVRPDQRTRPPLESGEHAILRPATRWSYGLLGLLAGGIIAAGAGVAVHAHSRPEPISQFVDGAAALKKATDGADVRWHEQATTIYFDRSLSAFAPEALDAVQAGFGAWLGSDARVPDLSFDSTRGAKFGKTPNGKSEISYGPIEIPGHEQDLALTITFSDQTTGEIVEADMIFNSTHAFGLLKDSDSHESHHGEAQDCQNKYDLQAVATHEAGHFFGLGEDYEERLATMYYTTGRCELHKRVLTDSDVSVMNGLYAQSDDANKASAAKGCAVAGGLGAGSSGAGYAGLALLGLVAARRRRR